MAPRLSPQERVLLATFAAALRDRFGERLRSLVLFGSRARGTGRDDSDLDVLVLVDGLTRAERLEVIDRGADESLAWGLVLSPLVVDPVAWRDGLPIACAIALEGVPLGRKRRVQGPQGREGTEFGHHLGEAGAKEQMPLGASSFPEAARSCDAAVASMSSPPSEAPSTSESSPTSRGGDHWVVRMNHRNRTAAFIVGFAALAAHAWGRHDGVATWVGLVLQFLAGPHVLYVVARRNRDPLRAEIRNTMFDAGAFGFWSGVFAFPLWITFIFFVGSIVNPGAFRGRKGLAQGIASFAGGALIGAAIAGFRMEPATSPLVTSLCIASVLLFLITVALGTYDRAVRLSDARTRLRQSERALSEQLDAVRGLETKLREQADRDPLTGLFNRRYLEPVLERELARCERANLPLTVMLVDVDHFKRVNDHYGHPAGDAVLRALAELLRSTVRASDVACRFGGEEFLLLLPEMPSEAAAGCAERLRARWEASEVRAGKHAIASTLSIGLATYPGRADTPESLVKAADLALYDAKRTGRNRAIAYQPLHGSLGKPAPAPPADAATSTP